MAAIMLEPTPCRLAEYMELVARHQHQVRSFVGRIGPPWDAAEDLTQQVFVVAFEKFESYDPSRELLPWLLGIARNVSRSSWRRHRDAGRVGAIEEALERAALEAVERADPLGAEAEALDRCVDELPGEHRELLALRHGQGLPSEGIARRVGRTAAAVDAQFLRIRRTLRACVARRLEGRTT